MGGDKEMTFGREWDGGDGGDGLETFDNICEGSPGDSNKCHRAVWPRVWIIGG